MTQWLRAFLPHPEDPSLIPSTHVGWLTIFCELQHQGIECPVVVSSGTQRPMWHTLTEIHTGLRIKLSNRMLVLLRFFIYCFYVKISYKTHTHMFFIICMHRCQNNLLGCGGLDEECLPSAQVFEHLVSIQLMTLFGEVVQPRRRTLSLGVGF